MLPRTALFVSAFVVAASAWSCAGNRITSIPNSILVTFPSALANRAEVLAPDAPNYDRAEVWTAVKPPGQGYVSRAIVVQLTQNITVFRMWSGPNKRAPDGRTNRIGSWWTYEPPRGTVQQYRANYEVCRALNDLTWVVSCTLMKGSVVAIGPGNSVSAQTCNDPTGREKYDANDRHWQLYVSHAFERLGPEKELDCPDESRDYEADPSNLARPKMRY